MLHRYLRQRPGLPGQAFIFNLPFEVLENIFAQLVLQVLFRLPDYSGLLLPSPQGGLGLLDICDTETG